MRSNKGDNVGSTPQVIRCFLASPGDVGHERILAANVITKLGNERRFKRCFKLELVAWDQAGMAVAMEATATPQATIAENLTRPRDCDLVVLVLWSRIGTPLPKEILKPDGSPYRSGTEWEYFDALEGHSERGWPAVWIYRRTEKASVELDDPQLQEKREQLLKLEDFLDALTNDDSSLAGGINYYSAPDDFRLQFSDHLRDYLERRLESAASEPPATGLTESPSASAEQVAVYGDVPYPGLDVFTPEQAPIFFGRGLVVDQLLGRLREPRTRFLAVVGVSGSGKSSLVAAGLLPLLRQGVVNGVPWLDLRFKPGERGENPFLALAFPLKAAIASLGGSERDLARSLRSDPACFGGQLKALLAGAPPTAELLLVIDQFEELFTLVPESYRKDFLIWLDSVVSLPRLRVLITLRDDFYARAVAEPSLANLLRSRGGFFPLDSPDTLALQEMIAGPAQLVGLEMEPGLVKRILKDAGDAAGALPLVAFTLYELYAKYGTTGTLSEWQYQNIGGIAGAVEQCVNTALKDLEPAQAAYLPLLFSYLVEVNDQGVATRRRAAKQPLEKQLGSEALVSVLTDARLLVSGKGENEKATVELAHEALLAAWPALAKWVDNGREALSARRDLERAAREWDAAGRSAAEVHTGVYLQRYRSAAEPKSITAIDYLKASEKRLWRLRLGKGLLGLLFVAGMGVFWHTGRSDYSPQDALAGLLVEFRLRPVLEPEMQLIEPVPDSGLAPFEIGVYEVTFAQYDQFASATGNDEPSSQGWGKHEADQGRGDRPVINVSWDDAQAYIVWLNKKTGSRYRLPTEAEWAYAAREGLADEDYWQKVTGGNEVRMCAMGNFLGCDDGYDLETAPVGSFSANDFLLHDMLGNVLEWVQDCFEDVPERDCESRVLRGGSWDGSPDIVRSADRFGFGPGDRNGSIGFRLARSP